MSYAEFLRRSVSFIFIVVLAVLLAVLAIRLAPILVIGLLCWIISIGLGIPINYFRRRGLHRGTAVGVTFLLVAIVLALFTVLILPPLIGQANNILAELPVAAETVVREYDRVRTETPILTNILPPFTVADYRNLSEIQEDTQPLDTTALARSTLPVLANIGGFFGNILVNLFLITFISIYFVLDPLVYYRIILAFVPRQHEQRAADILNQVRDTVVIWISAMVLEVTITAVMVAFALGVLLHIPNAVALGALAGLGNIIPYVGYWAALVPILIFALAVGGPLTALLAFVAYFVIGMIEANIILPANIGSRLKLPAGLVLLSQAAGAALLGFWGVLLAVPVLAILMVLIRELVVFDVLDKRHRVPLIQETPDGQILLDYPPAEEPQPDQAIVLTTETPPPPP
ncbi:MAG TPA: AI-2E family transporter [Phototrophicaceae bacterium]|nr:AI-2E family transporter [Phototrophicaceae bacterium]